MKRLKCTISYDGTDFCGFQVQVDKRTVQGEIERALTSIHKGTPIRIVGSGRTDANVHANGQVFHFDTNVNIPIDRWAIALQTLLPRDIVVKKMEEVNPDFHARFGVTQKQYRYFVQINRVADVFKRNYSYHFPYPISIQDMIIASEYLVGTHDFTSFCSAKTEVEDKVRTIHEVTIVQNKDLVEFHFSGNGFLYNMVRILVGTLLDVGVGTFQPEDIPKMLQARDRTVSGRTVPGHGLFLWDVVYDNLP